VSQWLFPTTRWAVYLRDDLRCVYCGVTIHELLAERADNFLTIDHFRTRSKGGSNDPANLVTCCYSCNVDKGAQTLKAWCASMGWSYEAVRSKTLQRRRRPIEPFRPLAKRLLGRPVAGLPAEPMAQLVEDHDWMVKRQWGDSIDGDYWEHLKAQAELFCHCGAPIDRSGRYNPPLEPETRADPLCHDPGKWWDGDGPPPF